MQKIESILGRKVLVPINVTGFAVPLFIRPLGIFEGAELLTAPQDSRAGAAWACRLLAASVVDASGAQALTADEWGQWPATEVDAFQAIVDATLSANNLKDAPGETLSDVGNESSPSP